MQRTFAAALLIALGMVGKLGQQADDSEWRSYGHDYTNQRYSPLAQINTSNVARLKLAWKHDTRPGRVPLVDGLFKQETTPIVVDGVLYYTYPGPQVFALD